jgi:hypothetical protein
MPASTMTNLLIPLCNLRFVGCLPMRHFYSKPRDIRFRIDSRQTFRERFGVEVMLV